jgi:hypothetical protein
MEPTYSLPLQTPRQLYEKLQREAARLDAEATGDNIFNFMVTAWHLIEWFRRATPSQSDAFKDDLAALERQPMLQICRDICDASKHFRLDRPSKTVRSTTPISATSGALWGAARWGEMQWSQPSTKETLVVEVDACTFDIREIKNEVLRLYNDLVEKHGI